jgi:hypothetical protein
MSKLDKKIEAYLGRTPDFETEVKLQDDGQGAYISFWLDSLEKPKPTDEQLNALESEATKLENNAIAVANRQAEYGTPEKMIEYITENGLEAWQSKVSEIKLKYPKENS